MAEFPIVLDTLGALLDRRHGLRAYCDACGRSAVLDLAALVEARGREYPLDRLRKGLRCRQCGAAGVIQVVAPNGFQG